jgi:hypothetical protein
MFSLLKGAAEWDAYKARLSQQLKDGLNFPGSRDAVIEFGRGPDNYPCLVASYYVPSEAKMLSCYVYKDNAEMLLAATDAKPDTVDLSGFAASVTANLFTIAHFLTETGICKREQYAAKYTEMLAKVDQLYAEQANYKTVCDKVGEGE